MYINAFRLADSAENNVGDALNDWLWPQLLPSVSWNQPTHSQFVGIGTLLNHWLYPLEDNVVFTTGVGYGTTQQHRHIYQWHLYALRGPLSAQALDISADMAITDGAYLIRRTQSYAQWKHRPNKRYTWGFIPHHSSYRQHRHSVWEPLQTILEHQNGRLISPLQSVDAFMDQLSQCEVILSESLHGAILADAIGIPWRPIVFSNSDRPYDHDMVSFRFKWLDWTWSIDAPYQPGFLLSPYHLREHRSEALAKAIERLIQEDHFYCSPEHRLDAKTDDLWQRLLQFEQDYHAGKFNTQQLIKPIDTMAFGLKHKWERLKTRLEINTQTIKPAIVAYDECPPVQLTQMTIQPFFSMASGSEYHY